MSLLDDTPGLTLALPPALVDAIAARAAELVAEHGGGSGDRWLTVEQAAEHMACSRQRIYDLASQGALVGGRDGSRRVFRRSELDAYLEGRRR